MRRGENLLPLFLNAVLCEFNVQKRCQTSNPEEENCLFSRELSSWTPFICKEVLQAQPSPSGWGEKSSAQGSTEGCRREDFTQRSWHTPLFLQTWEEPARAGCSGVWSPWHSLQRHGYLLIYFVFSVILFHSVTSLCPSPFFSSLWQQRKWFPGNPKDLGIFPLQWDPWCRGTFPTWARQLSRNTPDRAVRSLQHCQPWGFTWSPWAASTASAGPGTYHRQDLLENKPQPKLNLKWASTVHSGTVPLGTLRYFRT